LEIIKPVSSEHSWCERGYLSFESRLRNDMAQPLIVLKPLQQRSLELRIISTGRAGWRHKIATRIRCDHATVHNRGLLAEECDPRNQVNDKEAAAKPNSRRTNSADYLTQISLLSVGSAYSGC
jgi:hypothetical protein